MGLCGLKAGDDVQGTDQAAALRGQDVATPDSVFLQVLGPGWPSREQWLGLWRGVRTERWLYARWHDQGGRRLLIDLSADRPEMNNLAGDESYSRQEEQMEGRLQEWLKKTGDPFDTGKRLPITGMLDLGQAFITENWVGRAPAAYAKEIAGNHSGFERQ